MRKYGLLLVFTFVVCVSVAQPIIKFEKNTYDLGNISREAGQFTCDFEFVNEGNAPLVLMKVQSSCAYAIADWTKLPVEPGQKGMVRVIFEPTGRSGKFSKLFTVHSNAIEAKTALRIQGNLIAETIVAIEKTVLSSPKIEKPRVNPSEKAQFSDINKKRAQTREIEIENAGKIDLTIELSNRPMVLKAGEKTRVSFAFDTDDVNKLEAVSEALVNGKEQVAEYKIKVTANVKEDIGQKTEEKGIALEQRKNPPIIKYSTKLLKLGVLNANASGEGKITLTNKGVVPLEIRGIDNQNEELSVSISQRLIPNDETSDIDVGVNTKDLKPGNYRRTFTIRTNDPEYQVVLFAVSWEIK